MVIFEEAISNKKSNFNYTGEIMLDIVHIITFSYPYIVKKDLFWNNFFEIGHLVELHVLSSP